MRQLINTTTHITEHWKSITVALKTYIDYSVDHNDKKLKYKVGNYVRISKYGNIFAMVYTPK